MGYSAHGFFYWLVCFIMIELGKILNILSASSLSDVCFAIFLFVCDLLSFQQYLLKSDSFSI